MCEVMEKYEKIAAENAAKEAAKKATIIATNRANIKAIKSMITTFHATKEQVIQLYSEAEYQQALAELDNTLSPE